MHGAISSIPEELLEHILEHVVTPSVHCSTTRPPWHMTRPAPTLSADVPSPDASRHTHIAALLVSHTWIRIATPLHYRHVVLRSARHTSLLASTLRANPDFGHWVRSICVEGVFDGLEDVVAMCPCLEEFDMTIDDGAVSTATIPGGAPGPDVKVMNEKLLHFCASFKKMTSLKHLTIRKTAYAYLTLPRTTLLFEKLSEAIAEWKHLKTVDIAFRFSPPASLTQFTAALIAAPALRTVCTVLPSVWNSALLEICLNPGLERIELSSDIKITDTHLYLNEARKHTRLFDLIRTGTPLVRPRAHTMTAPRAPAAGPAPSVDVQTAQAEKPDAGTASVTDNALLVRTAPGVRRMSAV
ncbi:hypothetical protein SCP_0604080 [Sparassis crispa]|uniref:F-box domain-containing protein n=1 Tax=Sparassis crispa TaxID=139825 RepID=A0A401GQJ3_9APHY|nr:hypothetical protein SCP_0604080 [Sparassis crispa]GBE84429.1 hypothetical protein SCP_0604080 [Sparassis crispa]